MFKRKFNLKIELFATPFGIIWNHLESMTSAQIIEYNFYYNYCIFNNLLNIINMYLFL